jgi:hypothetical protein
MPFTIYGLISATVLLGYSYLKVELEKEGTEVEEEVEEFAIRGLKSLIYLAEIYLGRERSKRKKTYRFNLFHP